MCNLFLLDCHFPLLFVQWTRYGKLNHTNGILYRFLRGDQYAIALALLDEGKVVLGVLACPNLPLTCIAGGSQHSLPGEVGCLFFSVVGGGTYMHSLDSSSAVKVSALDVLFPDDMYSHCFLWFVSNVFLVYRAGASQLYWQSWRSIVLWIIWSSTLNAWSIQLYCQGMTTLHATTTLSPSLSSNKKNSGLVAKFWMFNFWTETWCQSTTG